MAKIVDYCICGTHRHNDLRGNVVANLQEGWTVWGSPYYDGINELHCQAMVKYEQPTKSVAQKEDEMYQAAIQNINPLGQD